MTNPFRLAYFIAREYRLVRAERPLGDSAVADTSARIDCPSDGMGGEMTPQQDRVNSEMFASFEAAFRGRVSGCRRRCECGIEYWDTYNHGYDWNDGEL